MTCLCNLRRMLMHMGSLEAVASAYTQMDALHLSGMKDSQMHPGQCLSTRKGNFLHREARGWQTDYTRDSRAPVDILLHFRQGNFFAH